MNRDLIFAPILLVIGALQITAKYVAGEKISK